MRKKNVIWLFNAFFCLINLLLFKVAIAEIIVLKSGDRIEANVIEKNDKYVTIDYKGASLIYYTFEIKSIDGKIIDLPGTTLSTLPRVDIVEHSNEKVKQKLSTSNSIGGNIAKVDIVSAQMYFKRGLTYYNKGSFDQAISDFNRAIKVDPNYVSAYANRGLVYSGKKDITQAVFDYTQAITINPRYEEAYYLRGLAYANQENFELAIADYTKAIEINPNYVQAYINRGFINTNKGNLEQAILDFDKALTINPDIAAVYYLRGAAYANKGNLEKAILDYNKAIEKNPEDAQFYANRGLVSAYKVISDRKPKIDQNSPMAYINLGADKIDKIDFQNAISDCNKAIEINSNFADAYISRERVYILMRECEKAWEDVHKAEALGAKIIPQILEDLKKISGELMTNDKAQN